MKHWGGQVAWAYPYGDNNLFLKQGMQSSNVLAIQKVLCDLGYLTTLNGIFDLQTYGQVKKFQDDFGLEADGVVGLRTLALLIR